LNDFKTVPSSIERILSGTWLLALAKINMIPGLKNIIKQEQRSVNKTGPPKETIKCRKTNKFLKI